MRKISLFTGRSYRVVKRLRVVSLLLFFIFLSMLTSLTLHAEELFQHENLLDLVTLLKEKEAALESREAVLAEKEIRMEMLQNELQSQEREMLEIRVLVEKIMADYKALKEEDLSRLVEVYSAMKPDAAAPLLSELELNSAVEVILRMPTKKSAKLLSAVEPERAIAISRAITEIKPAE
jgi:flagellar motility protein MotE (MotC chaperone)